MIKCKVLTTVMLCIFITAFTTNLFSQNVNVKIGGTGSNDEFQITDSEGDEKLIVQGDGNVGIGTTTPEALLDIVSTSNGILVPRMTQSQRNLISSPATGLLIYQTDNTSGFYFYNGSSWVVVGSGSMSIDGLSDAKTGGNSVFLGSGAGAVDDGTNNENTATGINSLNSNTSGYKNTANGYYALYSNTIGWLNTAVGNAALYSNTGGDYNTSIGHKSLYSNISGDGNTAIGMQALFTNTGNYNSAVGMNSLYHNTTGTENTSQGSYSLWSNTEGTATPLVVVIHFTQTQRVRKTLLVVTMRSTQTQLEIATPHLELKHFITTKPDCRTLQ